MPPKILAAKRHWAAVELSTRGSGDNFIAPDDALAIINYLNAFGSTGVPDATPEGESTGSAAALIAGEIREPDWLALLAIDLSALHKC